MASQGQRRKGVASQGPRRRGVASHGGRRVPSQGPRRRGVASQGPRRRGVTSQSQGLRGRRVTSQRPRGTSQCPRGRGKPGSIIEGDGSGTAAEACKAAFLRCRQSVVRGIGAALSLRYRRSSLFGRSAIVYQC